MFYVIVNCVVLLDEVFKIVVEFLRKSKIKKNNAKNFCAGFWIVPEPRIIISDRDFILPTYIFGYRNEIHNFLGFK